MQVKIEQYLEQVTDGVQYKGHVKIGGAKFDYDLQFLVPIPGLEDMETPRDKEEVRRLFPIRLQKGGADVGLEPNEYGFFFGLLTPLAVDFYMLPQTRDAQKNILGGMTGPLMRAIGAKATIGTTSEAMYDLSPETCAMLNAPKFGCTLTAA